MTAKEIEVILIEGLMHTPETRVDFYLSKARKNNCSQVNFCISLFEAYKRLEKYVNSSDYKDWGTNETTGEKEYILRTINLYYFTDELMRGTLDNENIAGLLPGLNDLTKTVYQTEKDKAPVITVEAEKPALKGFQSNLSKEQVQTLFNLLKGKYIDINTNPDHFKAIFKNEQLPPDCFIKWTKTNVLLAYFIKKMFHSDNPFDVWVKAEKIFEIKNLRQSENNPHPKGESDLFRILKNIYPLLQ